jgi:hypothetical protein
LTWFNVAISSYMVHGAHAIPEAWTAWHRRQLKDQVIISWNIPMAELGRALQQDSFYLGSSPAYVCGTGVQLTLQSWKDETTGATEFGIFTGLCSYSPPGFDEDLCDAAPGLALHTSMTRDVAGHSSPQQIAMFNKTFNKMGFGSHVFTASTPTDLEPHLVDRCLKLKATITLHPF